MDPQPEISSHAIKDFKKSKEKSTKKQRVLSPSLVSDKSSNNSRLANTNFRKSSKRTIAMPVTPGRRRGRPKGTTKKVLLARGDGVKKTGSQKEAKKKEVSKKKAESKKAKVSKKDAGSRKGAKDKESVKEDESKKEVDSKKLVMKLPSTVEHAVSQYPHGKVAALGHTDDFDVAEAPQWAGKEGRRFVAVFAPHHSIFDEEVVVGKRRRTVVVDYWAKKQKNGSDGAAVGNDNDFGSRSPEGVHNDVTMVLQNQGENHIDEDPAIPQEQRNLATLDRSHSLATIDADGVNDGTVEMRIPDQEDYVPNRIQKRRVGWSVNGGQKRLQKCRKTVWMVREGVNKDEEVVKLREHRDVATLKCPEEVVMKQPESINDEAEDPERSLDEICNFLADDFPTRYRRKKRRVEVMTID